MASTFEEIGKAAGCSSATVSRVLNNHDSVDPQLRDAVLKAAKQAGYDAARTKRPGRPFGARTRTAPAKLVSLIYLRDNSMEKLTVGEDGELVISAPVEAGEQILRSSEALDSAFYRRITNGVIEELERWGYKAMIQFASPAAMNDMLKEVEQAQCAGALLMGAETQCVADIQCSRPVVLVDLIHDGRMDAVSTDNQAGITAAFKHVYELGHRRIGYIGHEKRCPNFDERLIAYRMNMLAAGLHAHEAWSWAGPDHIVDAEAGVAQILSRKDRPTALLCVNDWAALGALRAAGRLGIRVPEELSIVGFDDEEVASVVSPPLTTVRTPAVAIGVHSARQLMLQIQQPLPHGAQLRLAPRLIVRGSTAPVAS